MSLTKLNKTLEQELRALEEEGRAKPAERVITGFTPPAGGFGPRYALKGEERLFLRMNSSNETLIQTCTVGPQHYKTLLLDGKLVHPKQYSTEDHLLQRKTQALVSRL